MNVVLKTGRIVSKLQSMQANALRITNYLFHFTRAHGNLINHVLKKNFAGPGVISTKLLLYFSLLDSITITKLPPYQGYSFKGGGGRVTLKKDFFFRIQMCTIVYCLSNRKPCILV